MRFPGFLGLVVVGLLQIASWRESAPDIGRVVDLAKRPEEVSRWKEAMAG